MKKIVKLILSFLVYISLCNSSLFAASTEWFKGYGGLGNDQSYASAVDANGNLYILNKFDVTCDFDPSAFKTANVTPTSGLNSVAISKYDANGVFKWVKSFSVNNSGAGSVYAQTMAIDKSGNIYFAGNFSGTTDFNPDPTAVVNLTPEPVDLTNPAYADGSQDSYVCKLDKDGNFVWVKQFRGDLNQDINKIYVDNQKNVFIAVESSGSVGIKTDLDPDTTSTFILTNTSSESQFVTKLDSLGNFVWAKQLQGTADRYAYGLSTDKSGNIVISGYYMGTIYPNPSNKTTAMTSSALHDIFLIKWDASGNYLWSKSMGAGGYDLLNTMEIDQNSGYIYLSGQFNNTVDFNGKSTPSIKLTGDGADWDGFIAKYDGSGNCLWAKRIGGKGSECVSAISLDGLGNLFIGGFFSNTSNFDAGASNFSFTSAGLMDGYVMKLDTLGAFKWAKQIGGLGNDWTGSVTATGDGNVFATGVFTFDATVNDLNTTLTAVDGYDVWMYKSSATTDIKELKSDARISVYPNPTFGKAVLNLFKETSEVTVTIRSAVGSQISSQSYKDVAKINLDFPKASGLYLVELKDAKGQVQTLKVLKK